MVVVEFFPFQSISIASFCAAPLLKIPLSFKSPVIGRKKKSKATPLTAGADLLRSPSVGAAARGSISRRRQSRRRRRSPRQRHRRERLDVVRGGHFLLTGESELYSFSARNWNSNRKEGEAGRRKREGGASASSLLLLASR